MPCVVFQSAGRIVEVVAWQPDAVSPALWHLASVLGWLQDQQRPVDATLLDVARATMKLQLPGATLPKDLEPLFA